MLLTADECVKYSNITATAATIAASGLLETVQERILAWTNNTFTVDVYWEGSANFSGSARTLTGTGFTDAGLASGDDVYISGSIRNRGIKEISTASNTLLTFTTASNIVNETNRIVDVELVEWPLPVKYAAAQMVAYDYDIRPTVTPGVRSRSLGPFSESFVNMLGGVIGTYPVEIMDALTPYKVIRLD